MQVGEDHVGHVGWGEAVGTQAVKQLAALVLAVVDGAGSGVDQDHPVAGADQETAEGELQPSLRVKVPGVASPRILPAGFGA